MKMKEGMAVGMSVIGGWRPTADCTAVKKRKDYSEKPPEFYTSRPSDIPFSDWRAAEVGLKIPWHSSKRFAACTVRSHSSP